MANPASPQESPHKGESSDPETIALGALVWVIGDPARADRLLGLTGLAPDDLRSRIGDPSLLAAVIAYLEGYEPDLIDCAAALGLTPAHLIAVGRALI